MTYPLQAAAQRYHSLKASLLEAMPDLAEDPECLLDTLEGETDINEQLIILLRSAMQDRALAFGLRDLLERMKERLTYLEAREHRKRQIALHYMEDLDIKKLTAPDMSVSRRMVPPSVRIIDEKLIPKEYMRVHYEPNKTAIKQALTEGKPVDGCLLSNTSETISIKI
jgi:hypothetical protein